MSDKETTIVIKTEDNYLSLVYFLLEHNRRFNTMIILHEDKKIINYYQVEVE